MELALYLADDSIESPSLTIMFMEEIIFELYLDFSEFLSEEEKTIVSPNMHNDVKVVEKNSLVEGDKAALSEKEMEIMTGKGGAKSVDKFFEEYLFVYKTVEERERDPEKLKTVLQKIQAYLLGNSAILPVVHFVFKSSELREEAYHIMIDEVKASIEGDLYHYDDYETVRNKILVKSYSKDHGKIDFLVEVKPEIKINNVSYFTKSITKAEQFEKDFSACFDFLEQAIKNNKKVLWEFG